MAARRDLRAGSASVPPGAAQALVALVLGAVATAVGVQRGDTALAVVFGLVALLGALGVVRAVKVWRSRR